MHKVHYLAKCSACVVCACGVCVCMCGVCVYYACVC